MPLLFCLRFESSSDVEAGELWPGHAQRPKEPGTHYSSAASLMTLSSHIGGFHRVCTEHPGWPVSSSEGSAMGVPTGVPQSTDTGRSWQGPRKSPTIAYNFRHWKPPPGWSPAALAGRLATRQPTPGQASHILQQLRKDSLDKPSRMAKAVASAQCILNTLERPEHFRCLFLRPGYPEGWNEP